MISVDINICENEYFVLFPDSTRNLALPDTVVQEALMLLQDNDEITFLASVKQETGDSGSIISFSSGLYR